MAADNTKTIDWKYLLIAMGFITLCQFNIMFEVSIITKHVLQNKKSNAVELIWIMFPKGLLLFRQKVELIF